MSSPCDLSEDTQIQQPDDQEDIQNKTFDVESAMCPGMIKSNYAVTQRLSDSCCSCRFLTLIPHDFLNTETQMSEDNTPELMVTSPAQVTLSVHVSFKINKE